MTVQVKAMDTIPRYRVAKVSAHYLPDLGLAFGRAAAHDLPDLGLALGRVAAQYLPDLGLAFGRVAAHYLPDLSLAARPQLFPNGADAFAAGDVQTIKNAKTTSKTRKTKWRSPAGTDP